MRRAKAAGCDMAGLHDSWNTAFEELKAGLTLDSSYVKVRGCCDRSYAHVKPARLTPLL